MVSTDSFRSGAREIARCYRLYRPPYPQDLLKDLLRRANISGANSLLDLACGPGRVGLSIASAFAAVTAVDLEPEMVAEGQALAVGEIRGKNYFLQYRPVCRLAGSGRRWPGQYFSTAARHYKLRRTRWRSAPEFETTLRLMPR